MKTLPIRKLIGDGCALWEWEPEISRRSSNNVLSAYRALKVQTDLRQLGMLDVIPAYSSLAVYFNPAGREINDLLQAVDTTIRSLPVVPDQSTPNATYTFDVIYDGEDLPRVSSHSGMRISEIIEAHRRPEYTVAMIGFLPHFPYLIGLDERIATPRLETPRKRVKPGSVAIGGAQAGIYPTESPGGWNLIGSTDPSQLQLIKPGDSVVFQEAGGQTC